MRALLRTLWLLGALASAGEPVSTTGPAVTAAQVPTGGSRGGVVAAEERRLRREHTVFVSSTFPYYSPATVRLRAGDVVRWVSAPSSEVHSVHETARGEFSLELSPGGEARVGFPRPGELHYRCRYHPWMAGRVLVEPRSLAVETIPIDRYLSGLRLLRAPLGGEPLLVRQGEASLQVLRLTYGDSAAVTVPAVAASREAVPALAADGAVWLTGEPPTFLVRLDPRNGGLTRHPVGQTHGAVSALTVAPGGQVWFHELTSRRFGCLSPARGDVRWHEVPGLDQPLSALRVEPSGAVWFLDVAGRAGFLDPANGQLTTARMPAGVEPGVLAVGDGAAWMVDPRRGKVLRLERRARLVELPLPGLGSRPGGLTFGPGGDVWITEPGRGAVARLRDGRIEEYPLASWPAQPRDLAFDRGGNLWLFDPLANRLGVVSADSLRSVQEPGR